MLYQGIIRYKVHVIQRNKLYILHIIPGNAIIISGDVNEKKNL